MNFQKLNSLYIELRDGLRAQVHTASMGDLNVRPPAGDADEASFLRASAWCYLLFFEAGRISIPFLLNLNGFSSEEFAKIHKITLRNIHALRTLLSHNLGFGDEHDLEIRKFASDWFVGTCGAVFPTNIVQWKSCCNRLFEDSGALIEYSSEVLSNCASAPERDIIFEKLRIRVQRDWPASEYDKLVSDAAARIGESINARALREQRLNHWRKFVETLPDDADIVNEVMRIIESDVLDHFRTRLPITGQDLIVALDLAPGPHVRDALEIARREFDKGVRDPKTLIELVRNHHEQEQARH